MGYKQPSSGLPFKEIGSSPAKQKEFNKTGSKASTTPGYSTTKAAKTMPKNFNTTGSSKAGKLIKWAGKKALNIIPMMFGDLSAKANTNLESKKSEGEQIKNLLTKHKLKGGNN